MKKDIPGYPGYMACNQGYIYSKTRNRNKPMYMKLYYPPGTKGTPRYRISLNNKTRQVHRLICLAFHGLPLPHQTECRHLNGNGTDNRPENLCWGTRQENIRDAQRLGEFSKRSKLNPEIVMELRNSYPFNMAEKARSLGVNETTIRDALSGVNYAYLNDIVPPVREPRVKPHWKETVARAALQLSQTTKGDNNE